MRALPQGYNIVNVILPRRHTHPALPPQISDWRRDHTWAPGQAQAKEEEEEKAETYLAQRYVDAPYLVGGKKFDLRIYALVVSYSPLRIYLYRCVRACLAGVAVRGFCVWNTVGSYVFLILLIAVQSSLPCRCTFHPQACCTRPVCLYPAPRPHVPTYIYTHTLTRARSQTHTLLL